MKNKNILSIVLILVFTLSLAYISYFGVTITKTVKVPAQQDEEDQVDSQDIDIVPSVDENVEQSQDIAAEDENIQQQAPEEVQNNDENITGSLEKNSYIWSSNLNLSKKANKKILSDDFLSVSAENIQQDPLTNELPQDADSDMSENIIEFDTQAQNPEGVSIVDENGNPIENAEINVVDSVEDDHEGHDHEGHDHEGHDHEDIVYEDKKVSNRYLSLQDIKLGLDLRGGVSILYQALKEDAEPTLQEMESAQSLIRQRLDVRNYTDADVIIQGNNRLRVDIPGIEDAEQAVNDIGQAAQLKFMNSEGEELLTGEVVKNAYSEMIQVNVGYYEPVVWLEFNEEGKELFRKATADNIDKPLIILLDNMILSSAMVKEEIPDGKAYISGGFSSDAAKKLAELINSGALPFSLEVVDLNNVGAKLGSEALKSSIIAGLISFGLIFLWMILTYKLSGLVANIALIMFIAIELILISAFSLTLTLPGIAGIILSVGMAVDANIIIFERIKEEVKQGKTLRSAMKIGFSRALPAILDGNITTLLAAVILFWLGTGPIKGFAQTLSIGIIISMSTALIISRQLLNNFVNCGISNPKIYGIKK